MDGNEARIERRAGSREVSGPRLASARAGKRGWRGGAVAFCASVFLTFAIDSTFAQTSAEIRHLYDDLNRLIAVIDASGNAVAYDYDAVGNVIAIRRVDAAQLPGPVGITLVSPNAGLPGTPVSVFGKGFGSTPGQNTVSFNGTPAVVTSAAANAIGTTVPEGAVSGPISVTTPLGSATSPTPFQVLGAIALSPPSAVVLAGNTHQFGATESGNPTATMTWSVNGAAGGNATVGTVSPSGLYAAPAAVPSPAVVTVTAADSMAPTLHASAQVLIVGTPLGVAVAAAGVSVQMTASPQPFSVVADARRVSVQIAPVNLPASATVVARAVVVAVEPVITAVSPATAPPGAVDMLVTLSGAGLSGATDLTFLFNNAVDDSITMSNLVANGDGTQATAQLAVASGAPLGSRVVRITTPAGSSTPGATGGNRFVVQ